MSASLPHWLSEYAKQAQWCAEHVRDGLRPEGDREIGARLAQIRSTAGPDGLHLPLLRVHQLARWRRGGMPIVEVSAQLAAAFCLTEYDAATAEDCRWPFPTFGVSLRGGTPLEIDDGACVRPCRLLWLHSFADAGGDKEFVLVEPEGSQLERDAVTLHAVSESVARIGPTSWIGHGSNDHSQLPMADCDNAAISNARRILVGLSLWLRERALGRPQTATPRTKAERRAAESGGLPQVWEIGREVPLVPALVDAARARGQRGDRAEWHLKKRFVVRGHWRRQAHGPGRAERTLKFIAPFWKGPRDGTGIAHLYDASETP